MSYCEVGPVEPHMFRKENSCEAKEQVIGSL